MMVTYGISLKVTQLNGSPESAGSIVVQEQ
jgi:hypothetical protein